MTEDFANNPPPLNLGAKKGRAIPGQTFEVEGGRADEINRIIGMIDKGNACGVAVHVNRWRGVTHIEFREMERMGTAFSKNGTRIVFPPELAADLIALIERARDFVGTLPAKKKVAVRKQTKIKPNGEERNESE